MNAAPLLLLLFSLHFHGSQCEDQPCAGRQTEYGVVCVCNATYCDTVGRPSPLPSGQYYHYSTRQGRAGFHRVTGSFSQDPPPPDDNSTLVFVVNRSVEYQEILGFGGSFSDAFGIVMTRLPQDVQDQLMESYFGVNGLEYSMARVPIGASDFSTRAYTYDDTPDDEDMSHFSLAEEDYNFKIPFIQKAISLSTHEMRLLGSPFMAPSWMTKSNSTGSYVRDELYHSWAKYQLKFLDSYADNGIKFWMLTGGNEPTLLIMMHGLLPVGVLSFPYDQRRWLRDHLGPMLAASNHSDVKLLLEDDMKMFASFWMSRFAIDPPTFQQVGGVALHWYMDWFIPSFLAKQIANVLHKRHPDKIILYSESSINTILFGGAPVELGSWERGSFYAYSIIDNLNYWVNGYIDWNLALDTSGGPNLGMSIDAAIIVNETSGEFYKNPIFYCIGHFSKFIPRGSRRVDVKSNLTNYHSALDLDSEDILSDFTSRLYRSVKLNHMKDDLSSYPTPPKPTVVPFPPPSVPKSVFSLATLNPDNSSTVIIFNSMDEAVNVSIVDVTVGTIGATLDPQSLNTFVYWPN